MAISICSGDSTPGSETPTLCTRKQSLQRSCLSWSSIQSWAVRQVKGLTGDISPKMKAKGTEELVLSQPAKTIAHDTNSTLGFDWLGYRVFKQSEFRRFCTKTQVLVNLEKSEGWQPGVLPIRPLSPKSLRRVISFEVPHRPLPPP